ncbi:alpha/beta hydrolase fold protein [Candidatus Protofrankia datiscae]|uniref:Alpha/beta hydrolase fold protein n=2 Tax=Frankiaceae TaxID=74712 RepID=F8B165_9ACTN|nr:alpha/beta fold hydrolase [Candidatus Protofrankia datiscae]AEH08801.1 alpha/beta hydrolase fold protein [Candidatus Protofrankia datiscae]
MPEVLANGVRLHVQRLSPRGGPRPGAPVVVMVHGMVMDNLSSLYFSLGTSLAHAGADVICYDLRGHGRSERTPDGYAMTDALADLSGLLDALGVDGPVHLVGNSYGATMALSYALEHAGQVASLTVIEPPFLVEGLGARMARSLARVSAGLDDAEVERWLERSAGRAVSRIARGAQTLLRETSIARDMLATEPFSPRRLARLNVPVLAVYGANSDIADHAEGLARLVPDCTLIVLAHHTHAVLREATDYLRVLLRWWLFEPGTPVPPYADTAGRRFETPDWVTRMVPPPDLNHPASTPARPGPDTAPARPDSDPGRPSGDHDRPDGGPGRPKEPKEEGEPGRPEESIGTGVPG